MKLMKFGILGLGLSLAACSPKITADGDAPTINAKPTAFAHQVQGPNLDGEWQSGCRADSWSENYVSFNIKIKNQDVTRAVSNFSDANCTQALKVDTAVGLFRYVKKYATDVYEVEYQIAFNGGHYYNGENVQLRDVNTLLISNRVTGEQVQPDIELLRVGALPTPPPNSSPTPGPTPAPTDSSNDSLEHSPIIGQEAIYTTTTYSGAGKETYDNQGFDSSANEWSVFYDISGGDQPSMGYDHFTSLWSTADYRDLMKTCVTDGGVIETVTVTAGTFKTCKITGSDHFVWKGNVPLFGIVKYETFDKSYSSELKSFIAIPK